MMLTQSEREYLLESMTALLDEYDYDYSEQALDDILDVWEGRKANLIEAFKKHPNYVDGKFMIAFNVDYERPLDENGAKAFWYWLERNAVVELRDKVPAEIIEQRKAEYCTCLPSDLFAFLANMYTIANRTITDETAAQINKMLPNIRAQGGQKTSRVINKICTYLGYDKADGYNREFARFADSLSPMKITRHTVLSLNPLDYLTMSFGNSWSSCHTIDKTNKRGMPNSYSGCYSSGTMSYMLDGASMVFYTVDTAYDGDDYWDQPKINRQMFHYCADKLVQGRLYPQDNDGCADLYTQNRIIVQEIIANIFDFPNLWKLESGTDAASRYIISEGTHYRDYRHYGNCTLSIIKGSDNEERFTVGANPICINCGDRHGHEDNISCCVSKYSCANCGCDIDEDDSYYVNGNHYCEDCVTFCEVCDNYELNDNVHWVESEDRYVCNGCLNEYYAYCIHCGEYYDKDDMTWIESEGRYVCGNCIGEYYFECDECEEYFRVRDKYTHNDKSMCEECYESAIDEEEAS